MLQSIPYRLVRSLTIKEVIESYPSLFAYRLLTCFCLSTKEYETANDSLARSFKLLDQSSKKTGLEFKLTRQSLDLLQADVYRCLGTVQGKRNLLALSLNLYARHLEKNPNHIDSLFASGLVLKTMETLDKAAEMFKRVIVLDPSRFEAKFELSLVFYLENDLDASLKICSDILDSPMNIPDFLLAMCFFQVARINWLDGIFEAK